MANFEGTIPIKKGFSDPSDVLANGYRQQFIDIYHIPSGKSVRFKAYVEDYSDQYQSEWEQEKVYGRMDPIVQYQGTNRTITLDWVVVASNFDEAVLNHRKCSLLFSMLYPSYEASSGKGTSATLINTAPIFKVKFGNLIQNTEDGVGGSVHGESVGTSAQDAGLVGTITGFAYKPDFEMGFLDEVMVTKGLQGFPNEKFGGEVFPATWQGSSGTMIPKEHKLSMEFTVLHTNKLGWQNKKKRSSSFPHGGIDDGETSTPITDEENELSEQEILSSWVGTGEY